jgi:hypothetical protein
VAVNIDYLYNHETRLQNYKIISNRAYLYLNENTIEPPEGADYAIGTSLYATAWRFE